MIMLLDSCVSIFYLKKKICLHSCQNMIFSVTSQWKLCGLQTFLYFLRKVKTGNHEYVCNSECCVNNNLWLSLLSVLTQKKIDILLGRNCITCVPRSMIFEILHFLSFKTTAHFTNVLLVFCPIY